MASRPPYAGPYINGSTMSSNDAAYVEYHIQAPTGQICKPYPSNQVINAMPGWDTFQGMLASGAYTPGPEVLAAEAGWDAYMAQKPKGKHHGKDHTPPAA